MTPPKSVVSREAAEKYIHDEHLKTLRDAGLNHYEWPELAPEHLYAHLAGQEYAINRILTILRLHEGGSRSAADWPDYIEQKLREEK